MLLRAIMGKTEPSAVNMYPGNLSWSEEVAVSQQRGTAEVAPHLSISFGIGQPGQELREKSLTYKPAASHPQAVPFSLAVKARGIWLVLLQVGVEVLFLKQAPSACRGAGVAWGEFTSTEVKPPGWLKPLGKYDPWPFSPNFPPQCAGDNCAYLPLLDTLRFAEEKHLGAWLTPESPSSSLHWTPSGLRLLRVNFAPV